MEFKLQGSADGSSWTTILDVTTTTITSADGAQQMFDLEGACVPAATISYYTCTKGDNIVTTGAETYLTNINYNDCKDACSAQASELLHAAASSPFFSAVLGTQASELPHAAAFSPYLSSFLS